MKISGVGEYIMSNIKLRPLGRSGLNVSPLMLGGNVFGWTADEPTSFTILDAWVDAGLNAIDTADIYTISVPGNQGGESETIIGKWLKATGKREKVVIATKLGKSMGEGKEGLSPAYMRKALEASLRRLQTDYIDLYQSHEDDLNTPMNETMEMFAKFIDEGKVRAIGASNFSAERLKQSLDVCEKMNLPRYECIQPNYNLCDRVEFESEFQSLCVEKEIGVINYFALAAGFLTGKYRKAEDLQGRARGARITKNNYLNMRGLRILEELDTVAQEFHSTPAAVTLAWEIAQPGITAPIVSATSLQQLSELIQAVDLNLSSEAIKRLTKASRYDE